MLITSDSKKLRKTIYNRINELSIQLKKTEKDRMNPKKDEENKDEKLMK